MSIETVRSCAHKLAEASWYVIRPMIEALSDEEFEKIPSLLDKPEVLKFAELYAICDLIHRGDEYTHIYFISGYIFKGETKVYSFTTN